MKDMRHIILVLTLFSAITGMAQRKEISQARTILKSGRNVQQAEQLMTKLLKDSANLANKRIYELWYESVVKQYAAVNERLYLKQQQDTAEVFKLAQRMFHVAWTLDSLDARPDKHGRIKPELRDKNAADLEKYRANLFFGGTFHTRKGNYDQAFSLFETYLDCAHQPLFSAYRLDSTDRRIPEAAYWATYCSYRRQDPVLTLRYRHLALRDTSKAEFTLQYMAEARRWLNDDSLYFETLRVGFDRYPQSPYFFPRLVDYYTKYKQYDQALSTANRLLAITPNSELALYAKSNALLSLERYGESIQVSDSLIAVNDTMASAYYNAGMAYMNKALKLEPRRDKKLLKQTYQKAQRYMERYRQLAPDQKQQWGPALYRIYLNLNLGRQFDEIDRLLKD